MIGHLVYTIGHSNRSIGDFIRIIKYYNIDVAVDIRSNPYSRFHPQFNKKHLEAALTDAGIGYVFIGDRLGGQPKDPSYYDEAGRVLYERLSLSSGFVEGIMRLEEVCRHSCAVLVCAERSP
ncbi:MAG: DUF488 domain-containing protein, partial [Pseudomonadota bacterium]